MLSAINFPPYLQLLTISSNRPILAITKSTSIFCLSSSINAAIFSVVRIVCSVDSCYCARLLVNADIGNGDIFMHKCVVHFFASIKKMGAEIIYLSTRVCVKKLTA